MASFPTNGDDVIFGNDSNNTINALGGNDLVFGGLGKDILTGGTGNDQLSGGTGLDILLGGSGSDTAAYGFYLDGVLADLQLGIGYLIGDGASVDGDQFFNIENLEGGLGHDKLFGNGSANAIAGNSGNDTINGRGGNDTLNGGTGDDYIFGDAGTDRMSGGDGDDIVRGGAGADSISGGLGRDALYYIFSAQGVTVDLATGLGSGGDAAGDSFSGFEDIRGSENADTLLGTRGANVMQGGKGADEISGRDGNDRLYGEGGGSMADDPLNAGNDILSGGGGSDHLNGEVGIDNLSGGSGADHFNFHKLSHSGVGNGQRDVIIDFEQGLDVIEVWGFDESSVFDGFTFVGTDAFSDGTGGEVRYTVNGSGNTIISFRTDTSGGADMQIELTGTFNLTTNDFIF